MSHTPTQNVVVVRKVKKKEPEFTVSSDYPLDQEAFEDLLRAARPKPDRPQFASVGHSAAKRRRRR